MGDTINAIPIKNLAFAFIPVLIVIGILYKWALDYKQSLYAFARMLAQLVIVGYCLIFIFESNNYWIVIAVLSMMVFVSSWIALTPIKTNRKFLYKNALYSISLGGGITLFIVTQGVLDLYPWYKPSYMIPLSGMIFANSMNSVSLAAERFESELKNNLKYNEARAIALRASLIPITNTLLAVGLVSLPGMMTGQILSGVSPLIAVRYQIMVLCMVFGSAGISSACFLMLIKKRKSITR